jgi:hypothetical protein
VQKPVLKYTEITVKSSKELEAHEVSYWIASHAGSAFTATTTNGIMYITTCGLMFHMDWIVIGEEVSNGT